MVAYPQFFDSTDTTQQTAAIAVAQNSGTTYGPFTYHLWNDKGGLLGGSTLKNCRIRPTVFNGVSRVSSGFPILDEAWVQVRLSGQNNVGDSTMQNQTTGFVPVGANNPLVLADIPKNCARYLDVQIVVPAGAGNLSQELYLELVYDEATVVLPLKIGVLLGPGIQFDWLDRSVSRIRRGFGLSASGTAVVSVAKGSYVIANNASGPGGSLSNILDTTLALNQSDVNAAALAPGESYIARISAASGTGISVTKGIKGATPTAPALPANSVHLGLVTVRYQAGGTSQILTADLDVSGVIYGEYLVVASTGLNVKVGAGTAISASDQSPFQGAMTTLALPDNSTHTVYLNPDGSFSIIFGTGPTGSVALANVTTAAGVVTAIVDEREYVGRAITEHTMTLRYRGAIIGTVTDADWALLPPGDWFLESVDFDLGTLGSGASSGSFKVDVKNRIWGTPLSTPGTTIYTSQGTNDQRPTIAYNASSVRSAMNVDHEICSFNNSGFFTPSPNNGMRFSFDIAAIPAGTFTADPEDAIVTLHFRKM